MLRLGLTGLSLAALILTGCDATVTLDSSDESTQEFSIVDEANGDNVRAHMTFLAQDLLEGRDTGTRGYDIARHYVAAQYKLLGLKPAGDNGSYFQTVPLMEARTIDSGHAMQIVRGGTTQDLTFREDYLPGTSYGDTEQALSAEVVFVGYGITAPELSHNDYDDLNVEGKIVAMLPRAPANFPNDQRAYYSSNSVKAQNALDRGAAGVIGLWTPEQETVFSWDRVNEAVWDPRFRWVNAQGEAFNGFPSLASGGVLSLEGATKLFAMAELDFLERVERAEAGEHVSTNLPVTLSFTNESEQKIIDSYNVAALLEGSDPDLKDEYVVVTSHLDHIGVMKDSDEEDVIRNGAYDNAAGIGVILEMARLIDEMPERPRRSILFVAVTAEEKGLIGSDYFAQNPTIPAEAIVANVNIDMPIFLYPLGDVIPFGADHSSLLTEVTEAGNATGFALAEDPFPEQTIFIRSDQFSFVKTGVPAVFLVPGMTSNDPEINGQEQWGGFLGGHYHRPTDDLSRPYDTDSAARYTAMNTMITLDIANEETRPTWNEGDFFGDKFGANR